jgi:hypothetical protein
LKIQNPENSEKNKKIKSRKFIKAKKIEPRKFRKAKKKLQKMKKNRIHIFFEN